MAHSHVFKHLQSKGVAADTDRERWDTRAQAIYQACSDSQRGLLDSVSANNQYLSVRCPRRSGKSYGMTSLALWFGERRPQSRVLIISLTLKSTKENFWAGAPGGIHSQDRQFGLGLKYNYTDLVWQHENGSRGRLAGAETMADIEHLRGAAAEADIAIVDECKSFAPELLDQLIRDVLLPGLMTRDGFLVLGGTPGNIPVGTFFEATSALARNDDGLPTCIPVGQDDGDAYAKLDPVYRRDLWRLHTWSIKDNTAKPHQWRRALTDKKRAGWGDDHPTWRREYLGEWVTDATDLVYSWAAHKNKPDFVTWRPERARGNVSGLPPELGPWRYVLGIDLGYVDDSALVLAAYSETRRELRHVWDFKAPGMTVDDFFNEVIGVIERFGRPDAIVADTAGGGSKMLVEALNQRYGLGIEAAKKTEKQDHIELVNSDFAGGRIKIIPNSDLAHELAGLQWDLSRDSKTILARTGRLREDPNCPNHLCDALLYLYRYSYHYWSITPELGVEKGSAAYWAQFEKELVDRAIARRKAAPVDPHGLLKWARGRDPWN